MAPSWTSWTWSSTSEAVDLWRVVHDRSIAGALVVLADTVVVAAGVDERLVRALEEPLAATVSPIPVPDGDARRVTVVDALTTVPPPTLALVEPSCAAFAVDVLRAVWREEPEPRTSVPDALAAVGRRLVEHGWRHVGAPGLGLRRAAPATMQRRAGWGPAAVDELEGPANESLATHQLWARTRRGVRLVIDGPCLDGGQHNGSQALVANVSEALAAARPDSTVMVAVESRNVDAVRATMSPDVAVIERGSDVDVDVVYRPYQLLAPGELAWLTRTGARLLVGQLDMIGFANPAYHPSPALFHTVRNLQRLTMRVADGVTFISEFGLHHARIECPDLEADRCFVVHSGASVPGVEVDATTPERRFALCLSAVFWHKHREQAIRAFAAMVQDHGYDGDLVIAGPEPFYGRSSDAEAALVATLPDEIRRRVVHLGQVDDRRRWNLLAQADVVLYPSVVEGFGMVPFEAAAVGTASLVGPGSALEEVFADTGVVVESWDAGVWAGRAIEIASSDAVERRLVAAVRSRGERYTWATVADATWDAVDAVVGRPRARLHRDEGGLASRVTTASDLSSTAPAAHFVNRALAFGRRKTDTVRQTRGKP